MAAAPRTLSAATTRRQWTLVALLIAAGVVNYVDRSTLAIANHTISEEMRLSTGQMGLLLSAFAWAYGAAQLPMGVVSDRVGSRVVLSVAMAVWSLAQVVSGAVQSFAQFLVVRVFLGLGESPMFTAGARATVEWFPMRERGVPLGLFNAASSLGPALAPLPLTWLMLTYGWRWMFVVMGLLGFVVALAWWLHYRDPADAGVPPGEIAIIRAEEVQATAQSDPKVWAAFFTIPTTWALMGGLFGTVYVTWLCVSWLPYYLVAVRHLTVAETGLVATIPQFAGVAGGVLGGFLSDAIARRGIEPVRSRKIPTVAGLVAAAVFTLAAPLVADTATSVALFSAAMFFAYGSGSCSWTLGASLTPPHLVATLESIQNIGGSLGGALAPAVTGYVVQYTHSFGPAFLIAAVAAVGSGVSYALVKPKAYAGIGERTCA